MGDLFFIIMEDKKMGSCYKKIEINASVQDVWNRMRNFHDMSWAPNVVTSVNKQGNIVGTEVGAKRVLNEAFHETLTEVDADSCYFKYSIDDGPGPVAKDAVNNYIGSVHMRASDVGTLVEWSSSFESGHDNKVADFCNPIYSALLADLKKSME